MSGIAGIYYLDGRPVDDEVDRMVETIEHRGPDGISTWQKNSVGLGHCMLETTPEDRFESLPLVDRTGNFVITADARIDNRDELIDRLNVRKPDERPITDTELILGAYKKWGMDCPQKLLGAFAFAIWDGHRQRAFLARDHLGIKPLFYYHEAEKVLIFGSEIKAIKSLKSNLKKLNKKYISQHLLLKVKTELEETVYEKIKSLEPSHLVYTGENLKKKKYYGFYSESRYSFKKEVDYLLKFKEIIKKSVKCRLRSKAKISAHLSGGLDSSSIVSLAYYMENKGKLNSKHKVVSNTFTNVHSDVPHCNDVGLVKNVNKKYKRSDRQLFVDLKNIGLFSDIEDLMWHLDSPQRGAHARSLWSINKEMNRLGSRVLLSGFDGDTTLSHGTGYFYELRNEGKWIKLVKEVSKFAESTGESKIKSVRSWVQGPLLSSNIGEVILKLYSKFRSSKSSKGATSDITSIINENFIKEIDEYIGNGKNTPESEFENHREGVRDSIFVRSLESSDMYAAAHQVEPRYPLCDKRLVEFCLDLPPDLKIRSGWSRYILRRAMEGILPESVQWRPWKTIPADIAHHDLLTKERHHLQPFVDDAQQSRVADYLDSDYLASASGRYLDNPDIPVDNLSETDRGRLWNSLILEKWLRYIDS
ncbi:asparagine synthase (glutamine-hydrolyzing) [Salinibacter ruber]|uniref:asparagine synthase (glutamine-hydrolyzing) n=1 Tax=Salinibacter ruber TaxID=146919 RepID=UPI002168402F|nr:asparagine synthase (glutamine-hydrolyzing) [Salinibacter ruber]MCS3703566.1 asparagine synthase (glutamine-hydrolyzing) [Salinibacter ruber]